MMITKLPREVSTLRLVEIVADCIREHRYGGPPVAIDTAPQSVVGSLTIFVVG